MERRYAIERLVVESENSAARWDSTPYRLSGSGSW
jgi:hypothetical protein